MLLINSREEWRNQPRHYSSIIGAIGKALGSEGFRHSERADLMRYGRRSGAAGELVALRLLIGSGARPDTMWITEMRSWLWLVHCMALLSGANCDPHSNANEASPGRVLQRAGFTELRLGRLLDARGETFNILLERTVRQIARFGHPLNWSKIAPLLLSRDPESIWAENARLALSRDFLLSVAQSAQEEDAAVTGSAGDIEATMSNHD